MELHLDQSHVPAGSAELQLRPQQKFKPKAVQIDVENDMLEVLGKANSKYTVASGLVSLQMASSTSEEGKEPLEYFHLNELPNHKVVALRQLLRRAAAVIGAMRACVQFRSVCLENVSDLRLHSTSAQASSISRGFRPMRANSRLTHRLPGLALTRRNFQWGLDQTNASPITCCPRMLVSQQKKRRIKYDTVT